MWLVVASTNSSEQAKSQIVDVGGVSLEVPIPEGYCLPPDELAEHVRQNALADNRNATILTLVDCRPGKELDRYLVIKSPYHLLTENADRAALLASLAATFNDPTFRKRIESGEFDRQVNARNAEIGRADLSVQTELKPRGVDDVCAYIGGNGAVSTGAGRSKTMALAGCMTVVGHRTIALYFVTVADTPRTFETLYKPARALALSIRPVKK